jgi:hypothetical protein
MTKTVTRYTMMAQNDDLDGLIVEPDPTPYGDWVRYDDIKHLLQNDRMIFSKGHVDLLREAESAISVLDGDGKYDNLANRICAALVRFPDEPSVTNLELAKQFCREHQYGSADGADVVEDFAAWLDNRTSVEPAVTNQYREALEKIIGLSDLEMADGDGARTIAEQALASAAEPAGGCIHCGDEHE